MMTRAVTVNMIMVIVTMMVIVKMMTRAVTVTMMVMVVVNMIMSLICEWHLDCVSMMTFLVVTNEMHLPWSAR